MQINYVLKTAKQFIFKTWLPNCITDQQHYKHTLNNLHSVEGVTVIELQEY